MATPKNITIDDLEMGRLYITPPDAEGNIQVQSDYRLVGTDPLLLTLGDQVLTRNVPVASLPQNIRDALIAIDAWRYNEGLIDQGMV